MKVSKELKEKREGIAISICEDIYSCLKVIYKFNIDGLPSHVMIKVLANNFPLEDYFNARKSFCNSINSISKMIHNNPINYFNSSYKEVK